MKKIMFVCLGNICRSPLAHAVFEHIITEQGTEDRYLVDSSGTIGYHRGEPADGRMRETALARGVRIDHRSQQLNARHLREFDLIICMDAQNKSDVLQLAEDDHQLEKIQMLRDYDPQGPGDVPDPYYGGKKGFETVFDIVMRSCQALYRDLQGE